jgi:uncharacterized protein HemY
VLAASAVDFSCGRTGYDLFKRSLLFEQSSFETYMPFLFLLTALLLFFGFFVAFIFFCVLAWIIYKYFRNRKRDRINRLLDLS